MADTLNRYVRSGTPVYIARAAYEELVTRAPAMRLKSYFDRIINLQGSALRIVQDGFESPLKRMARIAARAD